MYLHFFKRAIDLVFVLLALPFVSLAIIIVAPLIWVEDRGTVFYRATRIGRWGVPFRMYKLRSMKTNAPDIRLSDGSTFNGDDDPRVTRIGRFLRKTSLDEIPQVFNILTGQMSWVGIRPDPLDWLDKYTGRNQQILSVRPGITGYNQAYFRNGADGEAKMRHDLYYAEHICFRLDMRIVIRTARTVLFREHVHVAKERK